MALTAGAGNHPQCVLSARCYDPAPWHTPSSAVDVHADRTAVSVGEHLTLTLALHPPHALPLAMLEVPVPAGFTPSLAALEALKGARTIERYETGATGVTLYFAAVPAGRTTTLRLPLTAAFPVQVTARPAELYAYYQPTVRYAGAPLQLTAR